jgi:hypothetical protein
MARWTKSTGAAHEVCELHKLWVVDPWICDSDLINEGVWVGPNLHRWLTYEWSGLVLQMAACHRMAAKLTGETPHGLLSKVWQG